MRGLGFKTHEKIFGINNATNVQLNCHVSQFNWNAANANLSATCHNPIRIVGTSPLFSKWPSRVTSWLVDSTDYVSNVIFSATSAWWCHDDIITFCLQNSNGHNFFIRAPFLMKWMLLERFWQDLWFEIQFWPLLRWSNFASYVAL